MQIIAAFFDNMGRPILLGIFILLFVSEGRWQLRRRVQSRRKRVLTNLIISIPAFALLRWVFIPVVVWLAIKNQTLHIGLNYLYRGPPLFKAITGFLLLDYGNYVWHILNHKWPLLWRFHLVHHTDPDVDISTAIRFHFGELAGSVIFRGAVIFLTGVSPLTVLVYEVVFEAATQFHHSNLKLPFSFERILNKLIVTPRMHGIHHSVIKDETDSNFSVIFCFWDRIHRTSRLNVRQQTVVTGLPAYSNHEELTLGYLLRLPFTRIRPWRLLTRSRDQGKEEPGGSSGPDASSEERTRLAE